MKKLITLILAFAMTMTMVACSSAPASETTEGETTAEFLSIPGTEDGVLTVGMECQYAPYNWTQLTDANGAVEIANNPGAYANGYDVMIAQKICEKYGCTWLDLNDKLRDSNGELKEEFTFDGLHINAKAYEIIAENVIPLLK
jgi:hypothetical protein